MSQKNSKTILSIIIPLYNNSSFLRKAFDVFERNIGYGFEVIIVDDCSDDINKKELNRIIGLYSFTIRVIENKTNVGPGVSRNRGIEKSSGEYITFLDADDYFSDDYFDEVMPKLALNYDCVLYDYCSVYKSSIVPNSIFFKCKGLNVNRKEDIIVFVRGSTVGKVYKRALIVDNKIGFLEQYRNEDMPFTKMAVASCESFYFINKPLYYYYQNEKSLMHNKALLNYTNAVNACNALKKALFSRYKDELIGILILEYVYSVSITTASTMTKHNWDSINKAIKNEFGNIKKNTYFKRYSFKVRFLVDSAIHSHYWLFKIVIKLNELKTKVNK